jgi:hypothetical protein
LIVAIPPPYPPPDTSVKATRPLAPGKVATAGAAASSDTAATAQLAITVRLIITVSLPFSPGSHKRPLLGKKHWAQAEVALLLSRESRSECLGAVAPIPMRQ